MRSRTLLSLAVLGLLLWASCSRADSAEEQPESKEDVSSEEAAGEEEVEEEEAEETPKKEKTTDIEEEKDVMVLHSVNFDRALSENQFLLVEFCK